MRFSLPFLADSERDGAQCRMFRFHRDCVEGMRRQNEKGLPGYSQKVFEVFWIA
jgi:hypothetical protein